MTLGEQVETTSDERVMGALSHFFGLIAALIVWATQKDKSRFLRFQALQAMAFDMVFIALYVILMLCAVGVVFVTIIAGAWFTTQATPPDNLFPALELGLLAPWGLFICIMPLLLVVMLIRIIAAVSVATGHDFRYPLIGAWVDNFLRSSAAAA